MDKMPRCINLLACSFEINIRMQYNFCVQNAFCWMEVGYVKLIVTARELMSKGLLLIVFSCHNVRILSKGNESWSLEFCKSYDESLLHTVLG